MAVCDICTRSTGAESKLFSSDSVRNAVSNGFNPFSLGLARKTNWDLLGVSMPSDASFQHWKSQLMKDQTDWNICPNCSAKILDYIK